MVVSENAGIFCPLPHIRKWDVAYFLIYVYVPLHGTNWQVLFVSAVQRFEGKPPNLRSHNTTTQYA